jgi:hypothetical protein
VYSGSAVVLRQYPLGTPGSRPAPEATPEGGARRENPGALVGDVCNRHLMPQPLAMDKAGQRCGTCGCLGPQASGLLPKRARGPYSQEEDIALHVPTRHLPVAFPIGAFLGDVGIIHGGLVLPWVTMAHEVGGRRVHESSSSIRAIGA